MKYLYLFRHADTLPPTGEQTDHERTLSAAGQEESIRIGLFLKEQDMLPQKVLCSTAVRTRTTLGLAAQALGTPLEAEFLHALYLASAGDLLHHVNELDDALESVMLVGHNPGIHHFAAMMATRGNAEAIAALQQQFAPGSLALIRLNTDSWNSVAPDGSSELLGFVTPSPQPSY